MCESKQCSETYPKLLLIYRLDDQLYFFSSVCIRSFNFFIDNRLEDCIKSAVLRDAIHVPGVERELHLSLNMPITIAYFTAVTIFLNVILEIVCTTLEFDIMQIFQILMLGRCITSKHVTLTQLWFNVEPPSTTSAQH